jgi:hypothetical protein
MAVTQRGSNSEFASRPFADTDDDNGDDNDDNNGNGNGNDMYIRSLKLKYKWHADRKNIIDI